MSPTELDAFLKVLKSHNVGAAILRPDGTFQITFIQEMPEMPGTAPIPGGWKSPNHLDNPDALDPAALNGRQPEPSLP